MADTATRRGAGGLDRRGDHVPTRALIEELWARVDERRGIRFDQLRNMDAYWASFASDVAATLEDGKPDRNVQVLPDGRLRLFRAHWQLAIGAIRKGASGALPKGNVAITKRFQRRNIDTINHFTRIGLMEGREARTSAAGDCDGIWLTFTPEGVSALRAELRSRPPGWVAQLVRAHDS